jgi:peptidoglycan-associated lipoprotein
MRHSTLFFVVATSIAIGCAKKGVVDGPAPNAVASTDLTKQRPADLPAAAAEMAANFARVHFDTDASTLAASSKAALMDNVKLMQSNPELKVQVQGHCDERGTTEYNLALGNRRAAAVQTYMAQSGVAVSRLATVSYGEEIPLSAGHDEVAWSENRRAEFRITYGQGAAGTVQ